MLEGSKFWVVCNFNIVVRKGFTEVLIEHRYEGHEDQLHKYLGEDDYRERDC